MRLRALIALVLSVFLGFMAAVNAYAADKRFYDEQGRYQGKVDDSGRFYDRQGRYQGKVDDNGRFYDRQGRYQGKQDANGRYYDRQGRYQGKQDANGRYYDRQGRYQGKRDANGRFYDRQGKAVGEWPRVFSASGTSGWLDCDRLYQVPEGAATLRFTPANFGTAGKVKIRNLRLEALRFPEEANMDAPPPDGSDQEALFTLDDAQKLTTPTRERICLNGLWSFRPVFHGESPARFPADGSGWGYFKVPGSWPSYPNGMKFYLSSLALHKLDAANLNSAWYRRTITVPASYFLFICIQFVNYYTVQGKKYFITYDRIATNRDRGDSEHFFDTVEDPENIELYAGNKDYSPGAIGLQSASELAENLGRRLDGVEAKVLAALDALSLSENDAPGNGDETDVERAASENDSAEGAGSPETGSLGTGSPENEDRITRATDPGALEKDPGKPGGE